MKIMIASDIHGSAYYCRELLKRFEEENADRLFLLGDILYHGPRNDLPKEYNPKEVTNILNRYKEKIISVRGNCDTEVDGMVLDFPILSDYSFVCTPELTLLLTHGHKYNKETPLPMQKGEALVYGHTHIPMCEEKEGITYINCGSVSIPKENSPHSYITVNNGVVTWKDIEGKEYKVWSK